MFELSRHDWHWSRHALALLFAAMAMVGTGEALAPTPAAALISGECSTGQSSDACQDAQGGGPADAPPADDPGEVIVVTDSKPPEQPDFPPEKPVKTPPVDLGNLFGSGGAAGGAQDLKGPQRDDDEDPRSMNCGNYLAAFRDATIAGKNAPNQSERAKAEALADQHWSDYLTCRKTIAKLSGPPPLGECGDIKHDLDLLTRAGDDRNAPIFESYLKVCNARMAWEDLLQKCTSRVDPTRDCPASMDEQISALFEMEKSLDRYELRHGWRRGGKNGYPLVPRGWVLKRPPGWIWLP